jgi:hypothetical protein
MKTSLLVVLVFLFAAYEASAACAAKRSRDASFIELAVPEGSIRPTGVDDFSFVTDDTTIDALIARVGPPDASSGTRVTKLIWCLDDGTELSAESRDRVAIESVRHQGKEIFRRGKKK